MPASLSLSLLFPLLLFELFFFELLFQPNLFAVYRRIAWSGDPKPDLIAVYFEDCDFNLCTDCDHGLMAAVGFAGEYEHDGCLSA